MDALPVWGDVCYLRPTDRRPGALPPLIACGGCPALNDLLRAPFHLGCSILAFPAMQGWAAMLRAVLDFVVDT
jgi:hypothetical protein